MPKEASSKVPAEAVNVLSAVMSEGSPLITSCQFAVEGADSVI
jgi:hypothetical protein